MTRRTILAAISSLLPLALLKRDGGEGIILQVPAGEVSTSEIPRIIELTDRARGEREIAEWSGMRIFQLFDTQGRPRAGYEIVFLPVGVKNTGDFVDTSGFRGMTLKRVEDGNKQGWVIQEAGIA